MDIFLDNFCYGLFIFAMHGLEQVKWQSSFCYPFFLYQMDATAYPGNSGSPVYDQKSGKVVAVINKVFVKRTKESVLSDPSGITYAIPVRYLQNMLSTIE